jgi:hypothetical protein
LQAGAPPPTAVGGAEYEPAAHAVPRTEGVAADVPAGQPVQRTAPVPLSVSVTDPAGHAAQPRLPVLENVPGSHLLHARSDVAEGRMAWRSPAAHTMCLIQKLRPVAGWNSPLPHGEQELALTCSLKLPLSHGAHVRSCEAFGKLA